MKQKRPKIPEDVKLKLWVLSGGRCEFPGCNKYVWRDGLTLKDDNFAHMAHLVAASPDGPRGDKFLSPKLVTDFSNLMLVCLDHSKLIDGKHKSEYSVEFLQKYKAEHENRIKIQTSVSPEMATTVLKFIANVKGRKMEVSTAHANEAIFPRFPSDEKGILLDFTHKEEAASKKYWQEFSREIASKVKQSLTMGVDHKRVNHLSVFAVGPISTLMCLGNCIGGSRQADIYQKHRDSDDWKWKDEPKGYSFKYKVIKSNSDKSSKKIALILSLSGKVNRSEVEAILKDVPYYEITISKPDRDYLQYQSQLHGFTKTYRALLAEIRSCHGNDCEINLFPAIPVSVAVSCGRELLPKADPKVLVYDYDSTGFKPILKIN